MNRSGYGNRLLLTALLLALALAAGIAMANYASAATQTPLYSQGVMANSTSTPERFDDNDDDDDDDDCYFSVATEDDHGLRPNQPMVFNGTIAGTDYRPQRSTIDGNFKVDNSNGSAACLWSAEADEPWITLLSATGDTPAYGETAHQFSINEHARDLKAGTHNATIEFSIRTGFYGGKKKLYVELVVIHPCRFEVDGPDYLEFAMQDEQDTDEIKAQTVTISNPKESAACTWTADSGQNWLTIDPARGELDGGAKKDLMVSLNPTAGKLLAQDGHELDIRLISGDITEHIRGRLDIEPLPCALDLLEQTPGLTAAGPYGGPFTPDTLSIKLTNGGGKDCRWNAATAGDGDWAAIIPSSGTIEPGKMGSVQLRVAQAADELTPGAYSETITFSASGVAEQVSTTADLKVATLPCELTAHAADALEFRRDSDGNYNRDTAPITISNGAHRKTCRWNASAGDWLTVNPVKGELAGGESATVTATLDQDQAGNLAPRQSHRSSVKFMHTTSTQPRGPQSPGPQSAAAISEIPASLELDCRSDRPCAVIHADRTSIQYGESVETTLTLYNRGETEIVATLVLNPPSGWSLAPGDFGDCSGGGCTKRARIAAGESDDIAIQANPNEPASAAVESVFTGNADYHPSGQPDKKDTHDIAIAVTVLAASDEAIAAFQSKGLATPPPAPAAATPVPPPTPASLPTPTPNPTPTPTPPPTPAPAAAFIGPPAPNPTPAPVLPDGSRHSDLNTPDAAPFWPVPDLTVSLATISIAAAIAVALALLVLLYRYGRGRVAARGSGGGGGNSGRGNGNVRSNGRRGRRGGNRPRRRRLRPD